MNFFSKKTSPEQFWKWFKANADTYLHFEEDQDNLLSKLHAKLASVNELLTFQLGPLEDGRRELAISPDGLKAGVSAVEELVAAAPKLPHWKVVAFKPPHELQVVEYGGAQLNIADVYFTHRRPGEELIDLDIYIKGYDERQLETFAALAFIILDSVIGERNVLTRIGEIQFHGTEAAGSQELTPIRELSKLLAPGI